MNKTWEIFDLICDFMLIISGVAGIALNLIHIDMMIMEHFTTFVVMNVIYMIAFILGWSGLSYTEEDS